MRGNQETSLPRVIHHLWHPVIPSWRRQERASRLVFAGGGAKSRRSLHCTFELPSECLRSEVCQKESQHEGMDRMNSSKFFYPDQDCPICRAKAKGRKPPHRAHHEECPERRESVGRDRDVEKQTSLNREFDDGNRKVGVPDSPPSMEATCDTSMQATTLRKRLDEQMNERKLPPSSKSPPWTIIEMVRYILSLFPDRLKQGSNAIPKSKRAKTSMQWYGRNFAGAAGFRFPIDDGQSMQPSPLYHSIQGMTVFIVRWEVISPGVFLSCTASACPGELIHDRMDFTKNCQLTPIYTLSGGPMWACSMQYVCNSCKKRVMGNCGNLLRTLPVRLRDLYPVYPRYAIGPQHFSRDFTDWLELMSPHCSTEIFAKCLYEKLRRDYANRREHYADSCKSTGGSIGGKYPTFEQWIGHRPPNSIELRNLLDGIVEDPLRARSDLEMPNSNSRTREEGSGFCQSILSPPAMPFLQTRPSIIFPNLSGVANVFSASNLSMGLLANSD